MKCERCGYEADYYDCDHWEYEGKTLCLDCINELEGA